MIDPTKLERFRQLLREQKLGSALLANPFSVAWLSDYEMPIQTGPSPFDGGPPLLFVEEDSLTLIVADSQEAEARARGIAVKSYRGYTFQEPIAPEKRMAETLAALVKSKQRVGVEWNSLPASLAGSVKHSAHKDSLGNLDGLVAPLRTVKTDDEIRRIRQAAGLCDLAQATLRRNARAGATELELWGDVHAAMEIQAGRRLPVALGLLAGPRTASAGGPPTAHRIVEGEWILADIGPRLDNYWGDCCNVTMVGPASGALRKMHRAVADALALAESLVRPGAKPSEIDKAVRECIAKNGYTPHAHHTGHGLGVSYHEEPRIVAYNQQPLQENMVVALEPGVYVTGVGGVRLEDIVLVTRQGCEVLTKHSKELT